MGTSFSIEQHKSGHVSSNLIVLPPPIEPNKEYFKKFTDQINASKYDVNYFVKLSDKNDEQHITPLYIAVDQNDIPLVQRILKITDNSFYMKVNVEEIHNSLQNALLLAVKKNSFESVCAILDAEVVYKSFYELHDTKSQPPLLDLPHICDHSTNNNILHLAILQDNFPIIKRILDHITTIYPRVYQEKFINQPNSDFLTPFHLACLSIGVVDQYGVDKTKYFDENNSIFINEQIVRYFLKTAKCLNVNAVFYHLNPVIEAISSHLELPYDDKYRLFSSNEFQQIQKDEYWGHVRSRVPDIWNLSKYVNSDVILKWIIESENFLPSISFSAFVNAIIHNRPFILQLLLKMLDAEITAGTDLSSLYQIPFSPTLVEYSQSYKYWSMLPFVAVYYKNVECLQILLQSQHINPNVTNKDSKNLLQVAFLANYIPGFLAILNNDRLNFTAGSPGNTMIDYITRFYLSKASDQKIKDLSNKDLTLPNILKYLKILLSHDKVDVNYRDSYGETPLFISVTKRCKPLFEVLIHHPDLNLNHTDAQGYSILHTLARYDIDEFFDIIVEKNEGMINMPPQPHTSLPVHVLLQTTPDGNTPLHISVKYNAFILVEKLVAFINKRHDEYNKANPNSETTSVLKNFTQITDLINITNKAGLTPVHIAVRYNRPRSLGILLQCHNFNKITMFQHLDSYGNNPFHTACIYGSRHCFDELFKMINNDNMMQFLLACNDKKETMLHLLIQNMKGSPLSIESRAIPLVEASCSDYHSCLEQLLSIIVKI